MWALAYKEFQRLLMTSYVSGSLRPHWDDPHDPPGGHHDPPELEALRAEAATLLDIPVFGWQREHNGTPAGAGAPSSANTSWGRCTIIIEEDSGGLSRGWKGPVAAELVEGVGAVDWLVVAGFAAEELWKKEEGRLFAAGDHLPGNGKQESGRGGKSGKQEGRGGKRVPVVDYVDNLEQGRGVVPVAEEDFFQQPTVAPSAPAAAEDAAAASSWAAKLEKLKIDKDHLPPLLARPPIHAVRSLLMAVLGDDILVQTQRRCGRAVHEFDVFLIENRLFPAAIQVRAPLSPTTIQITLPVQEPVRGGHHVYGYSDDPARISSAMYGILYGLSGSSASSSTKDASAGTTSTLWFGENGAEKLEKAVQAVVDLSALERLLGVGTKRRGMWGETWVKSITEFGPMALFVAAGFGFYDVSSGKGGKAYMAFHAPVGEETPERAMAEILELRAKPAVPGKTAPAAPQKIEGTLSTYDRIFPGAVDGKFSIADKLTNGERSSYMEMLQKTKEQASKPARSNKPPPQLLGQVPVSFLKSLKMWDDTFSGVLKKEMAEAVLAVEAFVRLGLAVDVNKVLRIEFGTDEEGGKKAGSLGLRLERRRKELMLAFWQDVEKVAGKLEEGAEEQTLFVVGDGGTTDVGTGGVASGLGATAAGAAALDAAAQERRGNHEGTVVVAPPTCAGKQEEHQFLQADARAIEVKKFLVEKLRWTFDRHATPTAVWNAVFSFPESAILLCGGNVLEEEQISTLLRREQSDPAVLKAEFALPTVPKWVLLLGGGGGASFLSGKRAVSAVPDGVFPSGSRPLFSTAVFQFVPDMDQSANAKPPNKHPAPSKAPAEQAPAPSKPSTFRSVPNATFHVFAILGDSRRPDDDPSCYVGVVSVSQHQKTTTKEKRAPRKASGGEAPAPAALYLAFTGPRCGKELESRTVADFLFTPGARKAGGVASASVLSDVAVAQARSEMTRSIDEGDRPWTFFESLQIADTEEVSGTLSTFAGMLWEDAGGEDSGEGSIPAPPLPFSVISIGSVGVAGASMPFDPTKA